LHFKNIAGKRVVRKHKAKPEWLPWYRARDYKGNLTEAEKRQLDAFRAQPKHPATRFEDLPEEVRNYVVRIELELHDIKTEVVFGRAVFVSLFGAAMLALHYTGCITASPWNYAADLLLLVVPWFFCGYYSKKYDEEFLPSLDEGVPNPIDEGICKEWELEYIVATHQQQRDAAPPKG
jgi:hypothetical protein